jgi:hypothetical protein
LERNIPWTISIRNIYSKVLLNQGNFQRWICFARNIGPSGLILLEPTYRLYWVGFMVLNATFTNISVISWWSFLLAEENKVPGENHRPAASHWQTWSQCCIEYTSPWTGFKLTIFMVIGTNCTGSCKSNYHAIKTTIAPVLF